MSYYGTETGFTDYHEARGSKVPKLNSEEILAGLLVASEWLDNKYRSIYPGNKSGLREQIRDWPRYDAYDVNGDLIESGSVPVEIENATYEAALKHLCTPGLLNKDYTPPKYKKVAVSGAVSVEYARFNSVRDTQAQFSTVNQIMSNFLDFLTGDISSLSGQATRM